MVFITDPPAGHSFKAMSPLDVQNISTRIPRFHSNTTIEEMVMNSFTPHRTSKFCLQWFFSFRQIVSSQQLIVAEQPQKDLHTRRNLKPPHIRRMNWFDAGNCCYISSTI